MNGSTSSDSLLQAPVLYVDGLAGSVRDEEIVEVLSECLRLKLNLTRDSSSQLAPMSGTIEFETLSNAEKAYATRNHQIFTQHGSLELHLSPPPSKDPLPLAQPRLIKSLPRTFTAGKVFDLCRPFGPIHSATLQLSPAYPPGSGPPKFKGQALVTFYEEEDGQKMVEGLNFLEVEGQNIIVALWDARRAAKARRSDISSKSFNSYSNASSPVQHKEERTKSWASSKYPPALSATSPEFVSPAMSRNVSGTSQWSNNTGDTSFQGEEGGSPKLSSKARGDGLSIDPCNLFIKSLDPSLSSQDLYALFAPFGKIISARVMMDAVTSRSKEFGFVSFEEPGQADAAKREMDGKLVGAKHVTVRLHEPKKLRESRLSTGGVDTNGESKNVREGEVNQVEQELSKFSVTGNTTQPSPSQTSEETVAVAPLSEHDRLVAAVKEIDSQQTLEIVELIESLPKKERVMCLFNPEVLKQKVQDALLVLEASKEEETDVGSSASPKPTTPAPLNPTPSLMQSVPTVPASIQALAKLPSREIIPLLPAATPVLNLSTPSKEDLEQTKSFMDELESLPIGQIKQKLGEKLFKVIKKSGIKRAPKITIDLLDTEELRPLSILLHYPEILKEKALLLSTSTSD